MYSWRHIILSVKTEAYFVNILYFHEFCESKYGHFGSVSDTGELENYSPTKSESKKIIKFIFELM